MTLDRVITDMYASMCFEAGARPDWSRQHELFAPGARLVRVNDSGVFEFDLRSFQENLEAMIESGLGSFWEGELWRETHAFDDVAHVLSAYEIRGCRGGDVIDRAVKSIQLFRRNDRWWISAMLWRRQGENVRVADAPPSSRRSFAAS
jgi:hypothetical protein